MHSLIEIPHRGKRTKFSTMLPCAVLLALFVAGCSDSDGTNNPDDAAGSGPLTTTLDGGGNSVAPPKHLADDETWSATFGSLLVCTPEQVTITKVVPHYKVGEPVKAAFYMRTVPSADKRQGPPIQWAPVGTSSETPADMANSGDLRYGTLTEAADAKVDQPCSADPDDPFAEILTNITADSGGVWIDRLDVKYKAGTHDFSLPVDWSYVACGDLITDHDIC
jgi:hypothetical protein